MVDCLRRSTFRGLVAAFGSAIVEASPEPVNTASEGRLKIDGLGRSDVNFACGEIEDDSFGSAEGRSVPLALRVHDFCSASTSTVTELS